MSHSLAPHDEKREGPNLTPPGEDFKLYRRRKADEMRTRGWHGYYWAKRIE
jgi:hypothetical protein